MAGSGRHLTYAQLDERANRLASALHALGLRRGDTVALLGDNTVEAYEVYWAATRSGLYLSAVNWHLAPEEAAYIIDDSDAAVLIASGGVPQIAAPVVELLTHAPHRYAFGTPIAGYQSYEDLLAAAPPASYASSRGSVMFYSSGTTGRPKGIKPALPDESIDSPHFDGTLLSNAFGLNRDDVYLSPAPIYHAAPLTWSTAIQSMGGTVVMMERFDAEQMLASIERYHVTTTQVVPTMFVRMLQLPQHVRERYDLSSLRLVLHGAAPCPPEVADVMIEWMGPILTEFYGASERNGLTVITSTERRYKRGSVGRAVLGTLHICDDDGNEMPRGSTGTVYFERDIPSFEYHNDPAKTQEGRHRLHENWSTVGDVGYLDDDDYLYLTDRKAFMIISGGVNIYPAEVENALALHPDIFDVAVIGIPDPDMGEQVKAIVQLKDGVAGSDELGSDIIAYVRARIAHYKAPRTVTFVENLPRTETGKLQKHRLVADYS